MFHDTDPARLAIARAIVAGDDRQGFTLALTLGPLASALDAEDIGLELMAVLAGIEIDGRDITWH